MFLYSRLDQRCTLIDVPEARILSVSQILKAMHRHDYRICFGNTGYSQIILPRILAPEIKPQRDDIKDQQRVTAQVRSKSDEVARSIPGEEHLRTCWRSSVSNLADPEKSARGLTCSVTSCPAYEVECDNHRLLGLPSDIPRKHAHR